MSQESFSSKIECICSRKCIHSIKISALQAKIFQFLSQKIVYLYRSSLSCNILSILYDPVYPVPLLDFAHRLVL